MRRPKKTKPIYDRILAKTYIPVKKNGTNDEKACWIWQGGKNNAGYGLIREENDTKMILVHRAMGRHFNLKCTPSDQIQHTCLTRLCVNPDHLVNGTIQDRANRMSKAGRFGKLFNNKKLMWPICEYCGETNYLPHFKRLHAACKLSKKNKYITSQIIRKKT